MDTEMQFVSYMILFADVGLIGMKERPGVCGWMDGWMVPDAVFAFYMLYLCRLLHAALLVLQSTYVSYVSICMHLCGCTTFPPFNVV